MTQSNLVSIGEYLRRADEERKRWLSEINGFVPSWGIQALDDATKGIRPGWHVIKGPAGVGKTTIATRIMNLFLTDERAKGFAAIFAEYEMPPQQLSEVIMASMTGISRDSIFRGNPDAINEAMQIISTKSGGDVFITDDMPIEDLLKVYAEDDRFQLLIIDYLQIAHTRIRGGNDFDVMRTINRLLQITGRSKPIVTIASENADGGVWGDSQAFYHTTTTFRLAPPEDEALTGRSNGALLNIRSEKNRIGPPVNLVIEVNFANGTIVGERPIVNLNEAAGW